MTQETTRDEAYKAVELSDAQQRVAAGLVDPQTAGDLIEVLYIAREMVYDINITHGWYDAKRTFGDDVALIHSEVSEALEAFRVAGARDQTAHFVPCAPDRESWDTCVAHKPEGVGSELADVLVRVLDTCKRYDIDLGKELIRKLKYNNTRPYRHGDKKL